MRLQNKLLVQNILGSVAKIAILTLLSLLVACTPAITKTSVNQDDSVGAASMSKLMVDDHTENHIEINISIWGWKGLGVIWGHVGHVMISSPENKSILSQYPHAYGGSSVPKGPNNKLSFEDTYRQEGSDPDVVFSVVIHKSKVNDFVATVNDHIARKTWDWDPKSPLETHCARSAYEALRAGGVLIDQDNKYKIEEGERKQILPNSVWHLLEALGVQPVIKNKDNLMHKTIEDNEKVVTFARQNNLWS